MEATIAIETRKNLISKKRELQDDLLKRIREFEEETGLSVTGIGLVRPEIAAGADPTITGMRFKIELIREA